MRAITVVSDSRSTIARLHDCDTTDHQADLDQLNASYDQLRRDLDDDFTVLLARVHKGADDTLADLHARFDHAEQLLDQVAARRFLLPSWARRTLRLSRQLVLPALAGVVLAGWALFQAVTR